MTTLPQRAYADPGEIYERAEQLTCAGCAWVQRVKFKFINGRTVDMDRCARGMSFGHRCTWYRERKGHG